MHIKADDPSKMSPGPFELVYTNKPDDSSGHPNAEAEVKNMGLGHTDPSFFLGHTASVLLYRHALLHRH